MAETQNIEYKQTWHDDHLKWICGFANARGGRIYIGKDDKDWRTGLYDPKVLMKTLPNKIRDILGIVFEINLETVNKRQYIEIAVQPYSVPVSLRGRYYFRSGSSKMELTGNALNEFFLKKAGKTGDDFVEEGAALSNIDEASVSRIFAVVQESGCLPNVSGRSIIEILENFDIKTDSTGAGTKYTL